MKKLEVKKEYTQPELKVLGTMVKITQGNNGSCADGGTEQDQNCQGSGSG